MVAGARDRILFVCNGNTDRSNTAEWLYSHRDDTEARSAGIAAAEGHHQIELKDLKGADLVLVMEKAQYDYVRQHWGDWLQEHRDDIRVLGIPDEYGFLQPELIDELEDRADPALQRWRERQNRTAPTPPCVVCGDYRESQQAHFPKPARNGGTETIWLCPLHHKALDHGRIHRAEMEAIKKNAFPRFQGTVEEFVQEQHGKGYPLSLEGSSRNLRRRFWDAEPSDPRFRRLS